ncbi:hypothetical protein VDG1235_4247 [Verrucomicrobiia bacterium DG1235]|nr:hypothetical protein VDG1235_4247 [Verrucomicrobiae bacterium DG1235]
MPLNGEAEQPPPCEVAIEDFEIVRLVDGHGYHIEAAADKVGVSRSTAGRMLDRARRALALGIEKRAPLYLDASNHLELDLPEERALLSGENPQAGRLAIAVMIPETGSLVSRLFGRASAFVVLNDKGEIEKCIENPGTNVSRSASRKATVALKKAGVTGVAAGRFGPDALEYLAAANIHALLAAGLTVIQAHELFSPVKL